MENRKLYINPRILNPLLSDTGLIWTPLLLSPPFISSIPASHRWAEQPQITNIPPLSNSLGNYTHVTYVNNIWKIKNNTKFNLLCEGWLLTIALFIHYNINIDTDHSNSPKPAVYIDKICNKIRCQDSFKQLDYDLIYLYNGITKRVPLKASLSIALPWRQKCKLVQHESHSKP